MRYIILNNENTEENINARIRKMQEISRIYFRKKSRDSYIEYISIPKEELSVLFLVGHLNQVRRYIRENHNLISENTIVIITCYAERIKELKFLKNKQVYVPIEDKEEDIKYTDFNMGFDATKEEILLIRNKKKHFMQNIKDIFKLVGGS